MDKTTEMVVSCLRQLAVALESGDVFMVQLKLLPGAMRLTWHENDDDGEDVYVLSDATKAALDQRLEWGQPVGVTATGEEIKY